MSDLNQAIQNWRSALAGEEALDAKVLDELQDHLETELARMAAEDLTDDERVLIAARRVGAPDTLGQQFAANRSAAVWSRRFYWAVVGWLAFAVPGALAGLVGTATLTGLAFGAPDDLRAGTVAGIVSSAAFMIFWFLSLSYLWRRAKGRRVAGYIENWCVHHPGSLLALLLLLTFSVGVVNRIGIVGAAQNVDAAQFGLFALWQNGGGTIAAALIPIIVTLAAWRRICSVSQ